jgi:hypothetical protein
MVMYMDLEPIWQFFINKLSSNSCITTVYWKKITGVPFLYVTTATQLSRQSLEELIISSAAAAMKGQRLHSETVFVRQNESLFVYRHRFYVPQEKMFCCGNLCIDCTRLKGKKA